MTVSECEFFSDDCVGVVLQKWHPDKFKEEDSATSRFQEINEAYQGFASLSSCRCSCVCLLS